MKNSGWKIVVASLLGATLIGGVLSGCSGNKDEDPPPYKGMPGDKMPQASGTAGAPGGAKAPAAGATASPN